MEYTTTQARSDAYYSEYKKHNETTSEKGKNMNSPIKLNHENLKNDTKKINNQKFLKIIKEHYSKEIQNLNNNNKNNNNNNNKSSNNYKNINLQDNIITKQSQSPCPVINRSCKLGKEHYKNNLFENNIYHDIKTSLNQDKIYSENRNKYAELQHDACRLKR